ncbi:MAG: RNA-directed DNA polymerase [Methanobacteriota archaeon]|nr:MAG: RNA-directed DNA polymerase [Euryarchaeota archaeon]
MVAVPVKRSGEQIAICKTANRNPKKEPLMKNIFSQICSFETLQAAFERVKANAGCRGSDGVTITRFEQRLEHNLRMLRNDLLHQHYHPFPLMRFPIPKRSGKGMRYLSVPTVRDRIAQTAVFLVTRPIFEAEFENVSHAYRPGKGVRTALWDIKEWHKRGYIYAVDADITSYFDSIPHDLLLQKLHTLFTNPPQLTIHHSQLAIDNSTPLLRLFEKWIKAEIYDGERIWTLEKGIPQGSVVSPYLANLFLDELDETLNEFGMKLVRYADDFLILCKSPEEAEDAIEITDMLLEDLQLDLNPLKTKIVSFDQGFKFLGAILLNDGIYIPLPQKRKPSPPPKLPRPLTLKRYLELRNQ